MRFFSLVLICWTSMAMAETTPEAFLQTIYRDPYASLSPESVFAPSLADLWRQSLTTTRQTGQRGAASEDYFGCADRGYPRVKISIRTEDDPNKVVAIIERTCDNGKDTATIKLARFNYQWRVTNYTDARFDLRTNLTAK